MRDEGIEYIVGIEGVGSGGDRGDAKMAVFPTLHGPYGISTCIIRSLWKCCGEVMTMKMEDVYVVRLCVDRVIMTVVNDVIDVTHSIVSAIKLPPE